VHHFFPLDPRTHPRLAARSIHDLLPSTCLDFMAPIPATTTSTTKNDQKRWKTNIKSWKTRVFVFAVYFRSKIKRASTQNSEHHCT
jgi:hypothetical protein